MSIASDAWFSFMERAEGGLSMDRLDTGNYYKGELIGSNLGLTGADMALWLDRDPTARDMADITLASAKPIAMALYWQAMSCSKMVGALALSVCDFGYNAGIARSAKTLQAAVGATKDGWIGTQTLRAIDGLGQDRLVAMARALTPASAIPIQEHLGLEADGIVGPLTQAALARSYDGPTLVLLGTLADAQLAIYHLFAQFPRYGKGWTHRTADRLDMALELLITNDHVRTT